jgi:hypothetical protein
MTPTPILDKLTPPKPRLSSSDFAGPIFLIGLGLLLTIGTTVGARMNPAAAKNAPMATAPTMKHVGFTIPPPMEET